MVCAIGAFTVSNAEFDIVLMLVFGVVGYVLKKLDYPLAPLVLALVLGDRTEEAFRQSLLVSQGDLGVFFKTWLGATIMAAGIALAAWPVLGWLWSLLRPAGRRERRAPSDGGARAGRHRMSPRPAQPPASDARCRPASST